MLFISPADIEFVKRGCGFTAQLSRVLGNHGIRRVSCNAPDTRAQFSEVSSMKSLGPSLRIWVRSLTAVAAAFAIFAVLPAANAQSSSHPLDGLTAPEVWAAAAVLHASGKVDDKTRYPMIQLKEPPKEEVLAWKPGQPMRREAFVMVEQGRQVFEAVVDVNAKKLVSWTEIKGVQPPYASVAQLGDIDSALKESPEYVAGLKKRGITDLNTIFCGGYGTGYFGVPEEEGKRILRAGCFQSAPGIQGAGRPVQGLWAIYDGYEGKVIRVIDEGVVPMPKDGGFYDLPAIGKIRDTPAPLKVEQNLGSAFRLNGQSVSWEKWNFHFRIDRRVGLIVSNVAYQDGGRLRSILYEGSLSEMFVPYMDPSEGWFARTFFDAGEENDEFSSSLEIGADCPENAVYFDQVYADLKAIPNLKQRAACLFEQPSGYPAWRHDEGTVESRKSRELVLRTIGLAGNYDYIFDWIFEQNGTIRVRVGATGQDEIKAVKSRNAGEDANGADGKYGRFIAENIVGVDHDHFFSYRLDFDIDGTANSFVRDKLRVQRLSSESLRKSVWVAEPETVKTEEQAKSRMSMEQPEGWRVVNPNVKSPLGYPVGYELMGGENAMSLMVPEDYPQRRAGYTDYQLWVTPYRENERYAAGDYPTQSKPGQGLPAWTKANRSIENTDIVLWYTMGFHHIPHAEDWPVMPTVWHEFELKPVNFFDRNPALDLPK
jgi:primary-amine oxidase